MGHCPRASGARLRRINTEHIRPSGPTCGPSLSTHSERHREEKDLGFKSLWNSGIRRRADLDIRSLSKARHRQSRNCLTQSASCTFCVRFYTNLCAIPSTPTNRHRQHTRRAIILERLLPALRLRTEEIILRYEELSPFARFYRLLVFMKP
jgi:hypothetical protein